MFLFVVVVRFGLPLPSPSISFATYLFKEISRGDAFPFNWPHGLIVHDSVAQENVTLLASLTQNDLVH